MGLLAPVELRGRVELAQEGSQIGKQRGIGVAGRKIPGAGYVDRDSYGRR